MCGFPFRSDQPVVAAVPCDLTACIKSFAGTWLEYLEPCSTSVCGEAGKQKKMYKCSTNNVADCDPAGQTQCTATGISRAWADTAGTAGELSQSNRTAQQ